MDQILTAYPAKIKEFYKINSVFALMELMNIIRIAILVIILGNYLI